MSSLSARRGSSRRTMKKYRELKGSGRCVKCRKEKFDEDLKFVICKTCRVKIQESVRKRKGVKKQKLLDYL